MSVGAETASVALRVNGTERRLLGAPGETLLTVLRENGLTGAKRGCNQGVCGACTVLVDGAPVRSCLTVAADVEGAAVTTIEGLAPDGRLAPIQQAMQEHGAVQCGFCTSGMVLSAHAFLQTAENPSVDEIRTALSGNLCRCSGYRKIVDAVAAAAAGGGA
jgi:aerobic-type carbon monoxide dehydrogenase small subunit (CoxS/CutS family)